MDWLEFGRAMCAIVIVAAVMLMYADPSRANPAAQTAIGFSVMVSILLGVSTIFERYVGNSGNDVASDLGTLIEHLDQINESDDDSEDN